ncbi:MAG: DNA mismatch repair endonuclease MutL [Bacteroidota bacterium]
MADIIRLLPDHVANQIAAGEVVQRPASVVKELLENAIDARATSVKLIVKDGGKTLIQVVDDGIGMSTTDARMSFERHATSKIAAAADLFSLHTKGFRGEALASIAAIAHVDLHSKMASEDVGTHLKIEGSKVVAQEVAAVAKGTSVAVKNLFFNIPARRNFLKSDPVELRHIIDEFQRVALIHPEVGFQFYNNGAEMFNLPIGNFKQRIVHIFGSKTQERLVPVEEETDLVHITGFICKPEFARKSRGEQFFFANDRFIKSAYLHHAVVSAFEGLLKEDTHPGYFLQLQVDPKSIDVNIHPTKTEVKFHDERSLYALLRSAIKHSLGQFHVAPVLDFERDGALDTPYAFKDQPVKQPMVAVDADFNPFKEITTGPSAPKFRDKKGTQHWEALFEDTPETKALIASLEVESEAVNTDLFDEQEEEIGSQQSSFQLHRKYIVTTVKSGLLVINQNRAHQRILYERFLKEITVSKGTTQQLLFPLELQFGQKEIAALERLAPDLSDTGFDIVITSQTGVVVNGVPPHVAETSVMEVLDTILASYVSNTPETQKGLSRSEWLARTLSETLALKNGQLLPIDGQTALVNDLFACKEPKLSPSQKIIYVIIGANEIEHKF